MWKRRIILLLVLVAMAIGARQFWTWRSQAQQRQLALYEKQIADADPYKRLLAAEGLLRRDPTVVENRMIRVHALMELNRHAEAREELQGLVEKGTPEMEQYLVLQINSYLAEAEKLVGGGDRQRSATLVERVEAMMAGVQSQSKLITSKGNGFSQLLINARRLDMLVSAHRFALEAKRVELTKARLGGIQQSVETLGLEVTEMEKRVKGFDDELIQSCGRLMTMQPKHPQPVELLFRCHLRRGEFSQARSLAKMLATWETIPSETVAKIADALMDMETSHGEPVTAADIELAGLLLNHPRQTGTFSIQHDLALATHAIYLGNAEQALKIAQKIVAQEWLHSRALCIAARSAIIDGNPARAVEILQKYTELKRDPLVRYTLGLAYLASGEPRQVSLGQEALRQTLDIEPNHLPARLRLIESLASTGFLIEAADDILIVEAISPRHPRVLALKMHLAIESEDLGTIATLMEKQLANDGAVIRAEDVAMIVGMVLDDVPRVQRLLKDLAATEPDHVLVLAASRWLKLTPIRRARIAPVVVRTMLSIMGRDPLRMPLRPTTPVIGAFARSDGAGVSAPLPPFDSLLNTHLVPRPLDVALELTELALDQWPLSTPLISAATELNIWLHRVPAAKDWYRKIPPHVTPAEDSVEAVMAAYLEGDFEILAAKLAQAAVKNHGAMTPTHRLLDLDLALRGQDAKKVSASLTKMLQSHPWAEQALLMVVIDAMRRDQPDRAYAVLGSIDPLNSQLANLSRARLNVSNGRAADALHDTDKVLANESVDSDIRRWTAEVQARALLMLDQQANAVGVFDQLALTLKEHQADAAQSGADVLLLFGKSTAAAEVLSEVISRPDNSPRMLDQLLVRAQLVMKPSRVRSLVDTLLSYRANEPVLLLYQARATSHEDDIVAERIFKSLLSRFQQSPRVLMEMAEMMRRVQPDEAVRIYTALTKRGGRVGAAAQQLLDSMNKSGTKPSSSASVEGFTE